ncbi:uncharacterized protein LOC116299320 [Actinia tenebrosa]|uniref:Uncharacterized protein LOC116299320 n=1 Tax=Actinia tenebrosa TaxID=6105 RepID=A0A6P8I5I3_ACTTE|nr:uncharacterized protein LOC116299320 [Actinia tenebrosa]
MCDEGTREKEDKMNQLDLALQKLAETRAGFPEDKTAKVIRDELDQILQESVSDLSTKYRLFQGAKIQEGGSMTDGTKIGAPDEFDYLIEVPSLQEQLVTMKENKPFFAEDYSMEIQSTKLFLKIKDLSFLDDILCPDWCDGEKNQTRKSNQLCFKDGKSPWRDQIACMVSVAIYRSLQETLKKFSKWKHVARLNCPAGHTFLQILKFNGEVFVSVDICLAVTIPYHSTSQAPLMLLFEFSSINTISCTRRSDSEWENTALSPLGVNSVEKQCYRILKYLTQTFLESSLDIFTFEYKAVLETYTLKTTFLKVLDESQERWNANELGTRVLEILCLIRDDLGQVAKEKSAHGQVILHPLQVSMDYNLHPVSGEPALFRRSKVSNPKGKTANEPIFKRPKSIEGQVEKLINLLLMVKDTQDGGRHFFAILKSIEQMKTLLKDGTFQEPIMESLRERDNKSGVYNNFLLIWDAIDREEFKSFFRGTKFGITVQPEGKDDDCVVFPKSFSILNCLQCRLFEQTENTKVELLEMDVFETKQVVCWNAKENVDLYSFVKSGKCSFCDPTAMDE